MSAKFLFLNKTEFYSILSIDLHEKEIVFFCHFFSPFLWFIETYI